MSRLLDELTERRNNAIENARAYREEASASLERAVACDVSAAELGLAIAAIIPAPPPPGSEAGIEGALFGNQSEQLESGGPQTSSTDAPEIPEGFTPWSGGECPVPEGSYVEVLHRDGDRYIDRAGLEDSYAQSWEHTDADADIVAYRVLDQYVASPVDAASPWGFGKVDGQGSFHDERPHDEANPPRDSLLGGGEREAAADRDRAAYDAALKAADNATDKEIDESIRALCEKEQNAVPANHAFIADFEAANTQTESDLSSDEPPENARDWLNVGVKQTEDALS